MRRKRAYHRGWVIPALIAGIFGYLLGNWHAPHSADASAAQTVALRFPHSWNDAPAALAAFDRHAAIASATVRGDMEPALLDPTPMVPPDAERSVPSVQAADAEVSAPAMAPQRPIAKAAPAIAEAKLANAASRRRADRPGFLLDDAQIASIKERLHLTPDQERMWPAVEAALRDIAYSRAREARRAGAAPVAAIDPNSAQVQGLKSAAIPLIMSFSDEQKGEVRNLAHVMGLDQLASQF